MKEVDLKLAGILQAAADGKLASKLKAVRESAQLLESLPTKAKIRVLRNYTLENLEPLLKFECAQCQIAADVSFADFDTFEQEILNPASICNTGEHDLVVLSLWLDGLLQADEVFSFDPARIFQRIRALLEKLKAQIPAAIVVTGFLAPFFALETGRSVSTRESIGAAVAKLNLLLTDYVTAESRISMVDLATLSGRIGEKNAVDARFWYLYRAPLTNDLLGLLAQNMAAMIAALKGGSKKLLVLDCDNTLWGGIVGEDGLGGLKLDPSNFPGSAYYDFHRQLLTLKDQGVLLALCSKNNEADVLAVLDQHPHCLLKRDHFAGWSINWEDKVSGLRDLAKSLNLGTDSFVFIDDNPVECDWVRSAMPEVTVFRVPEQIFKLPALLRSFRGFDRLSRSDEDRGRTRMYREESQRKAERAEFEDLTSYLRSLELVATICVAEKADIPRIAQLTQKTNQFNLTTKRYSEGDIEGFILSPLHLILTMRVRDRFGDYGLTGLGIVVRDANVAHIDTFLLSCRILGRQLEMTLLGRLLEETARHFSVKCVTGRFEPTAKNRQVADFFDRAGFSLVAGAVGCKTSDGSRYYTHPVNEPINVPEFIAV